MDIGKAFSYVFDDEQWVTKILIGGLLSLLIFIPIVNFIVIFIILGNTLQTAQNVAMGSPRPLPTWDNFGEKLRLGFNGFLISLVYALPMVLISVLMACGLVAVSGAAGGSDEGLAAIFGGVLFCLVPLLVLLALAVQPLVLAATVRYLQTGSLGAAFQFGEIVAMVRSDLSGWVVLFLLYVLCGIVGSVGSSIIIGIIFTYPYGQAVFGHLLGQKLAQLNSGGSYSPTYAPPSAPTL